MHQTFLYAFAPSLVKLENCGRTSRVELGRGEEWGRWGGEGKGRKLSTFFLQTLWSPFVNFPRDCIYKHTTGQQAMKDGKTFRLYQYIDRHMQSIWWRDKWKKLGSWNGKVRTAGFETFFGWCKKLFSFWKPYGRPPDSIPVVIISRPLSEYRIFHLILPWDKIKHLTIYWTINTALATELYWCQRRKKSAKIDREILHFKRPKRFFLPFTVQCTSPWDGFTFPFVLSSYIDHPRQAFPFCLTTAGSWSSSSISNEFGLERSVIANTRTQTTRMGGVGGEGFHDWISCILINQNIALKINCLDPSGAFVSHSRLKHDLFSH